MENGTDFQIEIGSWLNQTEGLLGLLNLVKNVKKKKDRVFTYYLTNELQFHANSIEQENS